MFSVLEGEHTLVKTVVTARVGGLAKFAKKMATCIGCKAVLGKGYGKNTLVYRETFYEASHWNVFNISC